MVGSLLDARRRSCGLVDNNASQCPLITISFSFSLSSKHKIIVLKQLSYKVDRKIQQGREENKHL